MLHRTFRVRYNPFSSTMILGRFSARLYPHTDLMNELSTSVRPSSSQVAAGFFVVKDGGLRLCIDYHQLNDITIKNKYPPPLMNSTLEPLTQATVFTKLDLRKAYHLVQIGKGGTSGRQRLRLPMVIMSTW